MKTTTTTLSWSVLAALGTAVTLPVEAASTTVVISEFRTRGPGGGNDEFIELYNRSANAVNIGGWKINGSNSSGTISTRATIPANTTLNPGCRYLLTNSASGGYSGATAGDQTYSSGIADNGGLALLNAGNSIIDAVGMSAGSAYQEGTPLTQTTQNNNQSQERKPQGQNSQDTDDNASDFVLNAASSNPQNLATCASGGSDTAPSVSSSTPANNATTIALNANISVTFSEAVNAPSNAFGISCTTSGAHPFNLASLDSITYTLDPSSDFVAGETCTVTVTAAQVTDTDANDPPDNMAANHSFSFSTLASQTITRISTIQGSGSSITGSGPYTVEAIVTGDYQTQGSGQLRGFFIQEEDADSDGNPATSEGIFVFCSSCATAVAVGDKVQVTGAASEFFNMSQLTASTAGSVVVLSSGNTLPTPATVQLPVPGVPSGDLTAANNVINAYYEAFEGMLVTFPDTLSVAEYFQLERFGQLVLTEGGRIPTFTATNTPSAAGLIDHQIEIARRKIILDDDDNAQNSALTNNTPLPYPLDLFSSPPITGLSLTDRFRGGDTLSNLTGVLHWSFAGASGTDAWRIRPVPEQYRYTFTPANPRPVTPPDVGGTLTVASFNVLNYFTTVDTTASTSSGSCGPSGTLDCRGADSAAELTRQTDKAAAALCGMDADIVGLMEIENNATASLSGLVNALNAVPGCGPYSFINTGTIGGDAIKVGLLYKTTTVSPVGSHAILTTAVDARFLDDKNRPALAQTFRDIASGEDFTVAVNHFKSKGSACDDVGDFDQNDGQGNCNQTRTAAAEALVDWLAAQPTGSTDPDRLIIGDLNAYAKEDPITAIRNAGYTDLVALYGGPTAYGYVFDGQTGYLDHALANNSLLAQVTGVAEWHINADEPPSFDYNDTVADTGEASFEAKPSALPLYQADERRTSDHDPVLIGLDLVGAEVLGDLNNDNQVNLTDRNIVRAALGKCSGTAGYNAEADYDRDGCVTYADYSIWYGFFRNASR